MIMRRASECGLALGTIWALVACGTPTEGGSGPAGGAPVKTDVSGSAQKGPFSNGSQITIGELDANLVQTGRTFSTTMNDDGGAYSVRGVQLGTPYARVEVNGFYFDEVRGQLSSSPLSIFSHVDLSNAQTTNINLLGHLEAARLEHLVSEQGVSFGEAKAQAHREVLRLFQLEPDAIESAEALDISRGGEGNAALFAISIMLQGTRTVGELSELLSNIQSDLRSDGTLDDPGEECDGEDLRGQTCATLMEGWSGPLFCNDHCTLDRSACEQTCDNGQLDPGEECDPGLPLGDCQHCSPKCVIDMPPCGP